MISVSTVEPICSPFGERQHALITFSFLHCKATVSCLSFHSVPVCIGPACLLNLCLENVTSWLLCSFITPSSPHTVQACVLKFYRGSICNFQSYLRHWYHSQSSFSSPALSERPQIIPGHVEAYDLLDKSVSIHYFFIYLVVKWRKMLGAYCAADCV